MNNQREEIEEIMSKIQQFASMWALIDTRFDNGHLMLEAEALKLDISQNIEAMASQTQQTDGKARSILTIKAR